MSVVRERAIVFTRFPEAGKTKTRLIPALGAAGAARLQRQMSERTIAEVECCDRAIAVQIYFTGGTREQMQTWLGRERIYREQAEGDLGARLQIAFNAAQQEGIDRAIAIGIDCPELTAELIAEAFELLKSRDLVLGKAADGGYYLIGLKLTKEPQSQAKYTNSNVLLASLFTGIDWGSDRVFAQTVAIAEGFGSAIATLPVLHDIDYPEDLALLNIDILENIN